MDLPKIKDLKDLQALLDLMRRNDLAELEIEGEGVRLRLRKLEPRLPAEKLVYGPVAALPAGGPAPPPGPEAPVEAAAASFHVVKSPLVGTFYRSSSPEADPFVQEGDRVEADTVLCIIEAMKVMNEIPAGVPGIVRQILVKNGEAVEFGQALFHLEFPAG
jgi:acetyl-CoA carboxylase biotin carboxyl carrier protein